MATKRAFARRTANAGFGRSGTETTTTSVKDANATIASLRGDRRSPQEPPVDVSASMDDLIQETSSGRAVSKDGLIDILESKLRDNLPISLLRGLPREEIEKKLQEAINDIAHEDNLDIAETDRQEIEAHFQENYADRLGDTDEEPTVNAKGKAAKAKSSVVDAKEKVQPLLLERIDASAASELPRAELAEQVGEVVGDILAQEKINLNLREQRDLVTLLLNDMLGLGPLEPLLSDEDITDIMVNGPTQVYVERRGKLELTDVSFRDDQHLLNIATRIVTAIGRRVDESSPICDARLADGSRVNVIIPPLAIDGASISIRKFAKQKITLDKMMEQRNLSPEMGTVLKIAAACRLNVLISGGTGSGKTTMLNAMSRMIDPGERVVTIEDAAELQLQQPHVVRLETRPPNLEGHGEVTMRDLVKNSLRMRPDRVILGEIRGSEAVDMLQAMNTGHDGSLGTIHANRPREALTRLENMVGMAGINLPSKAVRTQIADALDLIVQVSRMRDGKRRVQYITEVVGMEGDVITTQDLFVFKFTGEDANGELTGEFQSTGVRPHFMDRAEYFNLARPLMNAMG